MTPKRPGTFQKSIARELVKRALPRTIRRSIRSVQAYALSKREEKKRAKWEEITAKNGRVVCKIARGVEMNLYGDSFLCREIYLNSFELDERDLARA